MDIVCDSSSLISFVQTCNRPIFYRLAEELNGKFIIPTEVYEEIFLTPLKIRWLEASALRLRQMVEDGIVEKRETKKEKTDEVIDIANHIFYAGGKPLKLIHKGEAGCLGLLEEMDTKVLLVDEKTTRLLIEKPKKMYSLLKKEHKEHISINKKMLEEFSKRTREMFIIRSVELLALAFEKGMLKRYGKYEDEAFKANIYALRKNGCSISLKEISKYEKIRGWW